MHLRLPGFRPSVAGLLFGLSAAAFAQTPPAAGVSPRIDAIKKAGVLRAAVLSNPPWLLQNTSGSGDAWSGPAWSLANEVAKQLGVKLQAVPVSHETKVPVLASNQADMTISPLSVTPERLNVVDFVTYSRTALCVFGRADNPKVANAKSIDEFNSPDITVAYFTGGGEENWVKKRFPKAKLRAVSIAGTAAPVEEIIAKRADVTPINRVPWQALNRKVKGLKALPDGNNCQDSVEMAADIGLAIDKNQPAFLNWLREVEKTLAPRLASEEKQVIDSM
ncbi:polar amino acid transport system substrate-binding protein [Polaromonas sp. OV174]|uniref:substrate-binding periplasmic protein n=1 Tax=Polaromonas sp. OV174 TaxID=1855300 RepID=UPI0008E0602C|nr:transporter substrate-binding domain-containing protein [Polaromonas sp. OV174]SFC58578.1 polar amino acid transport system substrate-binding protein [Polaromonas sp. OV174]